MSIETPEDLVGLREMGDIVASTLRLMATAVEPGISTAELDQIASAELARGGAQSSPSLVYGFPGAACISLNSQVIHGIPSTTTHVRPGDLVKLDLTAQKNGYVADAAVTVAVPPGGVTTRRLCECTRSAFERAMAVARAGNRISAIGRAVEKQVKAWRFDVLRRWCGHGIGRTIHEGPSIPNYDDASNHALLQAGMVVTVEPVITAGRDDSFITRDGWTVVTTDGAPSAHYEHTIVITSADPIILTA